MLPMRYEPFDMSSPFSSFRRDLDELFRGFFSEIQPMIEEKGALSPLMDLSEKQNAYELKVDLPGVDAKDLKVQITGNVLTIEGEKTEERVEGKPEGPSYLRERRFDRYQRSITLPESVAADKVQAHLKNGVLSLLLPKSEAARSRQIPIATGAPKAIEGKVEKGGEKGEKKAA